MYLGIIVTLTVARPYGFCTHRSFVSSLWLTQAQFGNCTDEEKALKQLEELDAIPEQLAQEPSKGAWCATHTQANTRTAHLTALTC